jgi:hypothetical protein
MRLRYEAGDPTALSWDPGNFQLPAPQAAKSSAPLPRPDPPTKYEKRDRAQYNRWERDCESYFAQSPTNFLLESQKINFGERYISEPLKTLWNAHKQTHSLPGLHPGRDGTLGRLVADNSVAEPTWVDFKTVMLNALGSKTERRHAAYLQLKNCKQRHNQSPTELLDYLRPLWEELGHEHTSTMKVLEFTTALRKDIQDDISREKDADRATIPQVEEIANRSWRRSRTSQQLRPTDPKNNGNRPRAGSGESEGAQKPQKKSKKPRSGKFRPKSAKRPDDKPTTDEIVCYRCGVAGHRAYDCTEPPKGDKGASNQKAGKGKGQKT